MFMHPALAHSECAADIMELLAATGQRMTTREIYDGLEQSKRLWGYSSIKQTLSLLVRLEMLQANHGKPWGYRIRAAQEVQKPRIAR
jgi:hypothetical protein